MTEVDPDVFRLAAGRFASGIVVVSTCLDDIPHCMTVSAFTSVSLQPLLVLFCAEKIARFHDAVLAAGNWAVSVLDEDSEKTSRWLATRGRPLESQLDQIAWHPGPVTGAPVLDSALAALECRTVAVHDGGDHSIIVGEVAGVSVPHPQARPLIFYASQYRRLSDDPAAPAPPDLGAAGEQPPDLGAAGEQPPDLGAAGEQPPGERA